jgi:DNA processing protein
MDASFWQRLLATDASGERCRALVSGLGNVALTTGEALRRIGRALSPTERENLSQADMGALQQAIEHGAFVLSLPDYPEPLSLASAIPPALFVWGDGECLNRPKVSIVGTRGASTYGRAAALKFAESLAEAGITVVSGGAAGIDAAAHEGAIGAGGKTVAALGTGIDQTYPAMHRQLFQRIRENGCLVSQFAAGTKPKPFRFPMRNHLIAALSDGVLIVEAPERSGALITAHAAAELGRQVFVVPANISNTNFRGSHALIRDGAALVDHPDQVLDALNVSPASAKPIAPDLTEAQAKIVAALSVRPLSAESIVDQTGLAAAEVLCELTVLELDGRVLRSPDGYAFKG